MRSAAPVPFLSSTSKEGYDARNVAVRSFERSQSCRNLFYSITVSVDSHRAGGGRNWADPVTGHRNTGCCSERVAHFLRGLHDPLWLCRAPYILCRIGSRSRCADCERQYNSCASNRQTAQATKSVSYSHAVMIPLRICASSFKDYSRPKKRHLRISSNRFNANRNI